MEEQQEEQNQNQEGQNEQPEIVIEQPKKKTIPTRLGSLIILLTATIAGAGVWWYAGSCIPSEVVGVSGIVEELQERREVKNELPEGYEVKVGMLYYKGVLIKINDINLNSLVYLGGSEGFSYDFFKNSQNVYRVYEKTYFSVISGADSGTFQLLDNNLERDKDNYYHNGKLMEGVDPNEVECMSGCYCKNDINIYYPTAGSWMEIEDADYNSFKVFYNCYAKDKNNVYHYAVDNFGIMNTADVETYEYLGFEFCKDKNYAYQFNNIIKGADAETFEYLGGSYAKDKNHVWDLQPTVYFKTIEVDLLTFEYIGEGYSKDKNNVYLYSEIMANINPANCTAEGCNDPACLAFGTKILMSDGNYKNIENIKAGDLVTSYDIETKEYKTAKVDKVIKRKDPLVIINNTLRAAPDEPVYLTDGSIKQAIDIKVGDYLFGEKGNQVEVENIKYNEEVVDTYDFTLENGNNFFADGYLVGTPDL